MIQLGEKQETHFPGDHWEGNCSGNSDHCLADEVGMNPPYKSTNQTIPDMLNIEDFSSRLNDSLLNTFNEWSIRINHQPIHHARGSQRCTSKSSLLLCSKPRCALSEAYLATALPSEVGIHRHGSSPRGTSSDIHFFAPHEPRFLEQFRPINKSLEIHPDAIGGWTAGSPHGSTATKQ